MSVTVTTHTSWFSRMKNSIIGALIGTLLVLGMVGLLFWNEGRAVKTARALTEGAGAVVSIDAKTLDPANEGRLVHVAGPVTPGSVPEDTMFGMRAEGAVGLNRTVEMYQWKETSKSETKTKLGGGQETVTTYDYSREWSSSRQDSSSFHDKAFHENPAFPVEAEEFATDQVTLGAFVFAGSRVASLGKDSAIPLTPDNAARAAQALGKPQAVVQGNLVFIGRNGQAPQVGDLRLGFTRADLKEMSAVGQQKGNGIDAWKSSNGREIFLSQAGIADAAKMFADAVTANNLVTWLVRVVGLIAMLIGFSLAFSILGVIGDVIPFVGSVVRAGTGFIALVLTALLGSVTIAIGWIAYRPFVGIAILAVGFAIAFAVGKMGAKKGAAAPAGATPA